MVGCSSGPNHTPEPYGRPILKGRKSSLIGTHILRSRCPENRGPTSRNLGTRCNLLRCPSCLLPKGIPGPHHIGDAKRPEYRPNEMIRFPNVNTPTMVSTMVSFPGAKWISAVSTMDKQSAKPWWHPFRRACTMHHPIGGIQGELLAP